MEPEKNIIGETKYIEPSHMEELSHILIQMEKVNMSGQQKIIGNHLGKETGWQIFERIAKEKISYTRILKALLLSTIATLNSPMDLQVWMERESLIECVLQLTVQQEISVFKILNGI